MELLEDGVSRHRKTLEQKLRCDLVYTVRCTSVGQYMVKWHTCFCKHLNEITPWEGRFFREKMRGIQPSQTVPYFYGTQKFITVLTTARHLYLSWAIWIQSFSVRHVSTLPSYLRQVTLSLAPPQKPSSCTPAKRPALFILFAGSP